MMHRRQLMTLLGGAAAWPVAAHGQQGRLLTVGLLGTGAPSTQSQWTAAFVQRLRELGWIEGQNVKVVSRWAEGRTERFKEIAAEFVTLKVDILVTSGSGVPASKQATSVIPIVFALANDPIGTGYVASLSQPGGNITGLSAQSTDLVGKRLELLREVMPALGRLAIMGGPDDNRSVVLEMDEVRVAARSLNIEVVTFGNGRADDITPAFEAFKGKAEALYVISSPLWTTHRFRINTLALIARLPTMYGFRDSVEIGGLISYGPDFVDLWRRAANLVDKIFRGTKAGNIPVEQPTKFNLVINLTTAKALGLTVPDTLLARADEVIE